jgi:hypothetical protein
MKVKLILESNYFNSTFSKIKLKNYMKNKALLVGINKYPDPQNELRGCINDILDMEHFIAETNKVYAKQNIKKLTDRDATKKGIVTQIKWLLEDAQPGDQLLFHYSGHGAQVPTLNQNLELDGLDEIICPYDFSGQGENALRDKEFAQLFAGIPKGVHFVWISDSCHAEDLSRDLKMDKAIIYRQFQGATINNHERLPETTSDHFNAIIKPLNGALLSACASHELSADAYIDNRFNGAFTHYLIKNLLQYSDSKSIQAIVQLVNIDLDKNGYDQNPESEGKLQNDFFFL